VCPYPYPQRKLKSKKEAEEEEVLSSRPAWVLDHNLANLWADGLDEDMIPEELRLTADTVAQIKRLQVWAEERVTELELEQPQPQPPQPPPPVQPPPPAMAVPTVVAAAAFASPPAPVPVVEWDPTVLARVAALKAGPRVGPSPASVTDI